MLRHPNVIQLHVVIETDADIFLVMEHVAGGDLLDFINSRGAMPEEQARDLVGQVRARKAARRARAAAQSAGERRNARRAGRLAQGGGLARAHCQE